MQLEVREYLSLHPAEIETTACISRFPRMDGYETAKQIKKLEEHKTTPIVMVTASIERSALSQGFRSGAVVFMNKPFTAKKFLTVIQTIIR